MTGHIYIYDDIYKFYLGYKSNIDHALFRLNSYSLDILTTTDVTTNITDTDYYPLTSNNILINVSNFNII